MSEKKLIAEGLRVQKQIDELAVLKHGDADSGTRLVERLATALKKATSKRVRLVSWLNATPDRATENPPAEDLEALWVFVTLRAEAGYETAVQDANARFWIIGGDEHGDHWATSFAHEDDAAPVPCSLESAPIEFPVIVFMAAMEGAPW
jgi:hypothetical protein